MSTLLLFLFIFGLFGWGIWRLLRYTRDTVGDNSPLKVQRVYKVSKRRYFMGFYGIVIFVSVVQAIALLFVFVRVPLTTELPTHPLFLYLLLFLVLAIVIGMGVLALALLLNHWPYARGVSITTNPTDHSLEIKLPDRVLTLREGDIERIEAVVNKARMGSSYRIYYLADSDRFLLPDRVPGLNVIYEYFPKIPFSATHSYFGFIKKGLLP